jgi:hypothetical protein
MEHTTSVFKLNKTHMHLDQATEAFNNYFLNLVDSLKVNNVNIATAISLLINLNPISFTEIVVIKITESELISELPSIKNKNSSDYNGILTFWRRFFFLNFSTPCI